MAAVGLCPLVWLSFLLSAVLCVDGGNIRLSSKIPGTDPNEGLLEVFLNGSWGAVCNEWFTYNDIPAKIACNELGYPGFDYFITDSSVYGDFSDLSPAIDYILCSEGENSILDCVRMPGNCSPQNYVALKCQVSHITFFSHSIMSTPSVFHKVFTASTFLPGHSIISTPTVESVSTPGYDVESISIRPSHNHGNKEPTGVHLTLTNTASVINIGSHTPVLLPTSNNPSHSGITMTTVIWAAAVAASGMLLVFFVIGAAAAIVLCKRRMVSQRRRDLLALHVPTEPNFSDYTITEFSKIPRKRKRSAQSSILRNVPCRADDDWEVEYSALHLQEKLGSGAFGMVYKATVSDDPEIQGETTVAVKLLKDGAPESEQRALLDEIELMKDLDKHPNVVQLLGCCTKGSNIALVMHYFPNGNLKDFLIKHRPATDGNYLFTQINSNGQCVESELNRSRVCVEEQAGTLSLLQLLSFSRQIALGMEYLAGKKLIHRDLATRNILVNKEFKLKIADFGLSRDVYTDLFYKTTGGKLPLRWMAIEAITDRNFTSSSDVWSYGIVLWEIVTYGQHPYPELGNGEVLSKLNEGYRMPQPRNCPDKLYKLMCDCWRRSPKERPSFSQALQALDEIISQDKDAEPYLELMLEECTKKEIGLELAPTSGVCRQESIDSDVFVD